MFNEHLLHGSPRKWALWNQKEEKSLTAYLQHLTSKRGELLTNSNLNAVLVELPLKVFIHVISKPQRARAHEVKRHTLFGQSQPDAPCPSCS